MPPRIPSFVNIPTGRQSEAVFGEIERLFGTATTRERQADIEEQVTTLASPDVDDKIKKSARIRLASLAPEISREIDNIRRSGTELDALEADRAAEEGLRFASFIRRVKKFRDKQGEIRKEIALRDSDQRPTNRLRALLDLDEGGLERALLKMQITAMDAKTLIPKPSKPSDLPIAKIMAAVRNGEISPEQGLAEIQALRETRAAELKKLRKEGAPATPDSFTTEGKILDDFRNKKIQKATAIELLLNERSKRESDKPDTFEVVRDKKTGKVVGQRNLRTKKIEPVPESILNKLEFLPTRKVERGDVVETEELQPSGEIKVIGKTKADPSTEEGKINRDVRLGLITSDEGKAIKKALEAQRRNDGTKVIKFNEGLEEVTRIEHPDGSFQIIRAPRTGFDKEQDTTLIKNLKAIGVDIESEEGKQIALKAILKPKVSVNLNEENEGLFKTPNGYMLLDENNPRKGVKPIPGGPQDNLKGENAGKAQMLRTAQKAAKGIRSFVFNKVNKDGTIPEDAEIDKTNLINAKLGTPFTKGRELASKMEFGIQAITRIETGAAMPAEELENTKERFMPKVFDSKKVANLKLDMFEDFIDGTLKLLDPTGRFNEERFQSELQARQQEKPANENQSQTNVEQQINLAIDTGRKTPEGFPIFERPDGSTFAVAP